MEKKLTIHFTSDLHGYLYATDFCSPEPCRQGLYSMRFPKDENTLVIDGGDALQGTPLTDYCFSRGKPSPFVEAMNEKQYDFLTLGNHDFSYGREYLVETLKKLDAECLCANIVDEKQELPVRAWRVKTMENGLRVGIIGLCTDWVPRWEKPENLKGFRFLPPLESARKAVREVQAEGVDVLIGLIHSGVERDLTDGRLISDTDEHFACLLCEELPFDLLLTAHQHAVIPSGNWKGTPLVQVGCNGVRSATVTLDGSGHFTSELVEPERPYEPEGERLKLYREMDAYLDTVIGELDRPFVAEEKVKMALHGAALADLFNLVQREVSGAELSCTGLSNTLKSFGPQMTLRDLTVNYPYANTLVVRRVNGKILKTALEKSASYFDRTPDGTLCVAEEFLKPCERHFNYDYFSGVHYTFDLNRPVGDRVTEMTVGGRTVRPEDEFELVMNNFRSGGAGGFEFYTACPVVREIRTELTTLVLEYMREHSPVMLPETSTYHCIE